MNHPILDKYWKIIIYLSVWLLFSYIYFWFVQNNSQLEFDLALLDSFLTSFMQASIYIGIWYVIKYNRIEEKTSPNLIISVILLGFTLIFFWVFIVHFSIILLIGKNTIYNDYFWSNIWNKALIGLVIYLFMLLFYYLLIYYQNFKENVIRKNQLSLKLQEQELANLKAQINPHFLFNSLNSISYLIYSDAENAHKAIVKLSDYFRYSLSSTKHQFITLEQELENTFRYLEIEKIRFEDKMKIKTQIEKECKKIQVPILILQPIIENAIKHGVYESTELVTIYVKATKFDDYIIISIKNNFDIDAKKQKGTGLGLENVKQRLELLYKRNDLLRITKEQDSFTVELFIPF